MAYKRPLNGICVDENDGDAEQREIGTAGQSEEDNDISPKRFLFQHRIEWWHTASRHPARGNASVDAIFMSSKATYTHVPLYRTENAQYAPNWAECDDKISLSSLLSHILNRRAANRKTKNTRSFLHGIDFNFESFLRDPSFSWETAVGTSYTIRNAKSPSQVFQKFSPRKTLAKRA